jgi:hypothetical protein
MPSHQSVTLATDWGDTDSPNETPTETPKENPE